MNEKVTITIDNGEQVEASAPVIISASRSTDIPAFMPSGYLTVWLKAIVLGIILSINKRCISHSRAAKLLCFGQRILNQYFLI